MTLRFFQHIFAYAELYAVLLAWMVVPLSYFCLFLYFRRQEAPAASPPLIAQQTSSDAVADTPVMAEEAAPLAKAEGE